MTVTQLIEILAGHVRRGRADYQIAMFHCPEVAHGAELVTDLVDRRGTNTLEFYSGTRPPAPYEPADFAPSGQDTARCVATAAGVSVAELSRDYRDAPDYGTSDLDELI